MNESIKHLVSKLKKSVLEKPYVYGFLGLAIIFVIPALIWTLYYFGDRGHVLIYTSLTVGDALNFYGSFITFLGTLSLTGLVIWQNHRYRIKDNEYRALADNVERDKLLPKLICQVGMQSGNGNNIKFRIENASDNYAHNITITDFSVTCNGEVIASSTSGERNIDRLAPHEKKDISFTNPPFMRYDFAVPPIELSFYIDCDDMMGIRHRYQIKGICSDVGTNANRFFKANMKVIKVNLPCN